jgi:hypothetical protein
VYSASACCCITSYHTTGSYVNHPRIKIKNVLERSHHLSQAQAQLRMNWNRGSPLLTRPGVWFPCTNTEALESKELRAGQSNLSNTHACISRSRCDHVFMHVCVYNKIPVQVGPECKGSGWGEILDQKSTIFAMSLLSRRMTGHVWTFDIGLYCGMSLVSRACF